MPFLPAGAIVINTACGELIGEANQHCHHRHRLCRSPAGLDRPARPPGRRAGHRQCTPRMCCRQRHAGLRRQTGGGDPDRLGHRRPGCCGAPFGTVAGASCLRRLAPLHRCRHIFVEIGSAIGSPWTREQAELSRREAFGSFETAVKGEVGPRGSSADCPLERMGPSRSPGARQG